MIRYIKIIFLFLLLNGVAYSQTATPTATPTFSLVSWETSHTPVAVINEDGTINTSGRIYTNSVKMLESAGDTYHTTIQGGDQTSNITYILPADDGASGEILAKTATTNTLDWTTNDVSNATLDGVCENGGTTDVNLTLSNAAQSFTGECIYTHSGIDIEPYLSDAWDTTITTTCASFDIDWGYESADGEFFMIIPIPRSLHGTAATITAVSFYYKAPGTGVIDEHGLYVYDGSDDSWTEKDCDTDDLTSDTLESHDFTVASFALTAHQDVIVWFKIDGSDGSNYGTVTCVQVKYAY